MENDILERTEIIQKAKEKWDTKTPLQKQRSSNKYKYIRQKGPQIDVKWDKMYDELSPWQKNILIKGQLIRTYDGLPNRVKTRIMRQFGLSTFSSKWFRLPSVDKNVLLKSILKHNG